jgi:hypothetical protein
MKKIYLDDLRTPIDPTWVVVRDYSSFVKRVEEIGLENIAEISLDHDLGDSAMQEYFTNVSPNYTLNYNNIKEKTGYDCAKWLVDHYYQLNPNLDVSRFERKSKDFKFPKVYTHSANPIGSANIMGYINNFLFNESRPQTCVRTKIPHII